jgi:leader peptidase (prepilin peptidase)/N-methyltransferase
VLETVGPNTLFLLFAGVFFVGASVGSFINVVVYRLPLMAMEAEAEDSRFNLAWPPSHCPHCSAPIRPWHNIPVLSYCWLQGRSACCRHRISPLYVFGEISAGLLAVTVMLILKPINSSDVLAAAWSGILVWWLLAIACLAWRHPGSTGTLSQTLLWLGLLANLQELFAPLHQAVFAVCCCYGLGWLAMPFNKSRPATRQHSGPVRSASGSRRLWVVRVLADNSVYRHYRCDLCHSFRNVQAHRPGDQSFGLSRA